MTFNPMSVTHAHTHISDEFNVAVKAQYLGVGNDILIIIN